MANKINSSEKNLLPVKRGKKTSEWKFFLNDIWFRLDLKRLVGFGKVGRKEKHMPGG